MQKRKGCVKYGCFGCAGVAGLFLLFVIVVGIGAVVTDEPVSREQRELKQDVPVVALPADDPSQSTTDDYRQPLFRFDGTATAEERGVVEVRLNGGSFEIEPGPAGEPIRVEGDFDTRRFELTQSYEPASDGEGWTYKVRFGPKGFFRWFNLGGSRPSRVRLILPRGLPFALTGNISMGESAVELGGLWLTALKLDTGMGEHAIRFGEPLLAPAEAFEVDGSMGSLTVGQLGNASPKKVSVKLSMGELRLDLDGPWAQDADVRVRSSMGECGVRLPEGVNVDLQRASIGLGERNIRGTKDRAEIPGAPTLRLDASHSMGELRIR